MTSNSRWWRRRLQIAGAALGLSSGSAYAADFAVNPGLLASWTFGERGGFGLGTEVSVMFYPWDPMRGPVPNPLPVNYGAFFQAEKLWGGGRTFRGALGVQAAPKLLPMVGGELGMALQNDHLGWGARIHGGAFASAAVVGLAFRGTFSGPGPEGMVQPAIVLTVKAPVPFGCFAPFCVVGRPLREGADSCRLPAVVSSGKEALRLLGRLERVGSAEQAALADEWLFAARGEFASVPAFLQLAEDLEHAGAPDSLVAAALTAAEDEVRHARVSFAVASAYAERPLAPDARQILEPASRRECERGPELARLAIESWVDGVVGEGAAARRAHAAAQTARDPVVAAVQRTIALEEATHARLGADVVAWCSSEGGASVRRALRTARDELADSAPDPLVRDELRAQAVT